MNTNKVVFYHFQFLSLFLSARTYRRTKAAELAIRIKNNNISLTN